MQNPELGTDLVRLVSARRTTSTGNLLAGRPPLLAGRLATGPPAAALVVQRNPRGLGCAYPSQGMCGDWRGQCSHALVGSMHKCLFKPFSRTCVVSVVHLA